MNTASNIFLEPWYVPGNDEIGKLNARVRFEISDLHPLFGNIMVVLAKRGGSDDILVKTNDHRVAQIHLTWTKNRDPDERSPRYSMFGSIKEWSEEVMIIDHREYTK